MTAGDPKAFTREILLGFRNVHTLHHATEQPVAGQGMLAELRHHGYHVSPGVPTEPLEAREDTVLFPAPRTNRGFWAAHQARTGWSMTLGTLFLLTVGAGPWSPDARLTRRRTSRR